MFTEYAILIVFAGQTKKRFSKQNITVNPINQGE
jgi:hypothetical protein